jgi:hypothetical protein
MKLRLRSYQTTELKTKSHEINLSKIRQSSNIWKAQHPIKIAFIREKIKRKLNSEND